MVISSLLGVSSISRKECANTCRGFLLIFLLLSRPCSSSVTRSVPAAHGGRPEFHGSAPGFIPDLALFLSTWLKFVLTFIKLHSVDHIFVLLKNGQRVNKILPVILSSFNVLSFERTFRDLFQDFAAIIQLL